MIRARSNNFFPSSQVEWSSAQLMHSSLKSPNKIVVSDRKDLTFSCESSCSFRKILHLFDFVLVGDNRPQLKTIYYLWYF